MARRRGLNAVPPPPPFGGVDQFINKMERAVIYRTVDRDLFTADDILDWLVPAEALRHLRAAFQYNQSSNSQAVFDARVTVCGTATHFHMNTVAMDCLSPHDKLAELQPTAKAPAIMAAIKEMQCIVRDHDVLRRVVNWFNENRVTPGFARHYFPALGSMLHGDHAFHQVDGQRFADRLIPYEIATDLRRAPEVIAKGLFCSPNEHGSLDGAAYCSVQFDEDGIPRSEIPLFAKVR